MSETDWLTATYFQDNIIYAADGNAVSFGYSGNDTLDGGHRYMEEVVGNTVIHYYDHTITLFCVDRDDLIADDFPFA